MGLLSTWNDSNKVVISDKVVTYSSQLVFGEWSYNSAPNVITTLYNAWEFHRYCVKTYMYVGMDRTTAGNCATAMVTKYTRDYKYSKWDNTNGIFVDENAGSMCMADIAIQQREGHMYDVIVSVREDDSRMRTNPTSPASLFTAENQRDYD